MVPDRRILIRVQIILIVIIIKNDVCNGGGGDVGVEVMGGKLRGWGEGGRWAGK